MTVEILLGKRRRRSRETELQTAILNLLRAKGIMAWRQSAAPVYDPESKGFRRARAGNDVRGIADIGGILPGGRALQIEVKVKPNTLSADQKAWRDRTVAAGGLHITAYSIEDVLAGIKS